MSVETEVRKSIKQREYLPEGVTHQTAKRANLRFDNDTGYWIGQLHNFDPDNTKTSIVVAFGNKGEPHLKIYRSPVNYESGIRSTEDQKALSSVISQENRVSPDRLGEMVERGIMNWWESLLKVIPGYREHFNPSDQ